MNNDHTLDGRKADDIDIVRTAYSQQQNPPLFLTDIKAIKALNASNEVCKSYIAQELTELESRLRNSDDKTRIQILQTDLELDIQQVDAICKAGEHLISYK